MVTVDQLCGVACGLPRAYEVYVRGRRKFRVGQIVFLAFSDDETTVGFGFPKDERDALVASDPDTFALPPASELRFNWACARLARLDPEFARELVIDAWRLCTPRMLHDLPDLPPPTAAVWAAMDRGDWADVRPLLHPYLHFASGSISLRGRIQVLGHLQEHPTPRPPREVEIRDGQIYRWIGSGISSSG